MPYEFYKVLHLSALFMTILSLGGATVHVLNGGTKNFTYRKLLAILHGVGLLIVLVSGFGAAARLGIAHGGLPIWIYLKIAVWLVVGIMPAVIYRMPRQAFTMLTMTWVLFTLGAYLAIAKPF